MLEHSDVEKSVLLMKFYPLSHSVGSMLCSLQGSNVELLFELNEEERTILQSER